MYAKPNVATDNSTSIELQFTEATVTVHRRYLIVILLLDKWA